MCWRPKRPLLNRGNRVMAVPSAFANGSPALVEAIDLADADLLAVLDQARTLCELTMLQRQLNRN